MFFLASELHMTVRELCSRMDLSEYLSWFAYYEKRGKQQELKASGKTDLLASPPRPEGL